MIRSVALEGVSVNFSTEHEGSATFLNAHTGDEFTISRDLLLAAADALRNDFKPEPMPPREDGVAEAPFFYIDGSVLRSLWRDSERKVIGSSVANCVSCPCGTKVVLASAYEELERKLETT